MTDESEILNEITYNWMFDPTAYAVRPNEVGDMCVEIETNIVFYRTSHVPGEQAGSYQKTVDTIPLCPKPFTVTFPLELLAVLGRPVAIEDLSPREIHDAFSFLFRQEYQQVGPKLAEQTGHHIPPSKRGPDEAAL